MTEAEWLACDAPGRMLDYLRDNDLLGDRAQREIDGLFSRPVWRLEVIRRRAPERQATGARQPRTLVGSSAG